MHSKLPHVLKKIFKVFAWIIGSVIVLLIAVALLIQIPSVQTWITNKAVSSVEKKIGTDVSLGGVRIAFPKNIVLEDIYLEDQEGDTLLYAGKLTVDTDLWGLMNNEIELNRIALENSVAFVDRAENDSAFNFTYILDAFAGDSTAVPDTLEQKGWNITLETLELENIRVHYNDKLTGNFLNASLGVFELEMSAFDLEKNTFGVESVLLANTRANLEQTKVPVASSDSTVADSTAALIFSLDELALRNINLNYEQSALGQMLRLDLGDARVLADKIDLENQEINLNTVSLTGTMVAYHKKQGDTVIVKPEDIEQKQAEEESKPWKFKLANLDFENNSIQVYDFTKPREERVVDFNHLWLSGFDISATDIRYSPSAIEANLENLAFHEQSGFRLKTFRGKLTISDQEASIQDLLLLTGNSRLQMRANATFPSLEKIAETYQQANFTTNINESYIGVRDLLYFNPSVLDSLPLHLAPGSTVSIDASVAGAVDDLNIGHLVMRMLSATELRMSGKIAGLPETENLRLNIALDKFSTTQADMDLILPDTLLPDSMQLPGWLNLQARYKGNLEKAEFNSVLTSDIGSIDTEGSFNLDSASALRGFNASVKVTDLGVGYLLGKPDSVMGEIGLRARVQTNGLSPEEMTGTLNAFVDHFDFQGYRYKDLNLTGKIENQQASLTATMTEENLDFTFDADYLFKDEVPVYNLTFDVRNADFQKLNLSKSPIRGRGTLLVDMATSDFQVLNGNVGIRKVAIFNGDDLYAIDSLLFASIDQEGRSEINIESDLLSAKFEGSINIFKLPAVMQEYIHSYYSLHDSLDVENEKAQRFSFDIRLKNTDILTGLLVPNLTTFKPGDIRGEFDSERKKLDLIMEIDEIQYANIGVRSFEFSTNSDPAELNYNLVIDKVMIDSMKIDGLRVDGTLANDSLDSDLIILDSADREKYVLAGTFYSREKGFELRLEPNGIVLNYQNWLVPENNYMRFGGEKFIAQNVQLVNRREKIIIDSDPAPLSPILIGFRELNLEYLASMIADERPLSGLLQGDVKLYPNDAGMSFTSDITIDDFSLQDIPWGDIALNVEQTVKNRFDVDFKLSGNGNDISANGFYQGGESAAMDITTRFTRFQLTSLQPLLKDQVQNLKGVLTGQIFAKGTPEVPDIDGSISLNNAGFLSTYLNTAFSIDGQTISFLDEGISFNTFEIADEKGNKAKLDGTIRTKTYRDFAFDLDLNTDNFRLFNTTAEDNELFYGKVDIEALARIRGNLTTPVVNIDIGLSPGSDLTYVVPQSDASILQAEGIVKFVDRSFEGDPFMRRIESEAADTVKSTFRGIDLTARVELTDEESFTVIIDPLTGDQLSVKGNSTLILKVDPTGDIALSGRYEISEGTYNLSFYKFVKREFKIEKGSTITWLGDPMNAQMDIHAIYDVETSPIELFSNQLTGADPSEVNQYKQRLPFLVYLNITGELLQPEISFKLEMPIEERDAFGGNVYARLQDINTRESDLNKQVFALLILKRFITDDPFENQAAEGFASTARRSVSKMLSEQLNRLSENIKGVELSFDIKSYEDYSSGQAEGQTELQLGVSKTLLNDRLVVKLSGNIDVEGENANRDATDYIGDLAIEYKLTPDGRFRITGFRNSNYDMIDGELIETGAGLIYVKDYNALSELFKANAETKN